MLEKPAIADGALAACVRQEYGVSPESIAFLPLGYDFSAAVYRVAAGDGGTYFLKVRFAPLNPLSVSVPRILNAAGVAEVVAPLPTITGRRWGEVDGHAALLYPFIEGEGDFSMTLTPAQWRDFGGILRRIHDAPVDGDVADTLPRETFMPNARYSDAIHQVHALMGDREFENVYDRQFADLWLANQNVISRVHERASAIGRMLKGRRPPFVLCHADIHKGNLLREPDGHLHVVDWDQPILAPKERDFVFILNGHPGTPTAEDALFLEGYGATEINRLALAYYRYEWVMQDIGSFGETILLTEAVGDETKRSAMYWFALMFAPGERIDAADRLAQSLSL